MTMFKRVVAGSIPVVPGLHINDGVELPPDQDDLGLDDVDVEHLYRSVRLGILAESALSPLALKDIAKHGVTKPNDHFGELGHQAIQWLLNVRESRSGAAAEALPANQLSVEDREEIARRFKLDMRFPGVEMYYLIVKRVEGSDTEFETVEAARIRFRKALTHAPMHKDRADQYPDTRSDTVLFDLEDGCLPKESARKVLKEEIYELRKKRGRDLRLAIRVNPFGTDDFKKDMALLRDIGACIDAIVLPKALEKESKAAFDRGLSAVTTHELDDLADLLLRHRIKVQVEPIIESAYSLWAPAAEAIFRHPRTDWAIFGIHDGSASLGVNITPTGWFDELFSHFSALAATAARTGKGLIGGVDPLISPKAIPTGIRSRSQVFAWIASLDRKVTSRDEWEVARRTVWSFQRAGIRVPLSPHVIAGVLFNHAFKQAQLGLVGNQSINPNANGIQRRGFVPSPGQVEECIQVLIMARRVKVKIDEHNERGVIEGGAIRFKGEMFDPPMFIKALNTLLNAMAYDLLTREQRDFVLETIPYFTPSQMEKVWRFAGTQVSVVDEVPRDIRWLGSKVAGRIPSEPRRRFGAWLEQIGVATEPTQLGHLATVVGRGLVRSAERENAPKNGNGGINGGSNGAPK